MLPNTADKQQQYIQSLLMITVSNFRPTQSVFELCQKLGERPVITILERMMSEVMLISGQENIPDPDTYPWICKQMVDQYPKLTIGAWSITLQCGVTGKYGPIYSRITAADIGQWVQKYFDITLPEIMERQRQKKIQEATQLSLPPATKKVVPPPPEFTDLLQKLTNKFKSRKPKTGKKFYSLKDYCDQNDIPYRDFIDAQKGKWEADFRAMLGNVEPTEKDIERNNKNRYEALLAEVNEMWEE